VDSSVRTGRVRMLSRVYLRLPTPALIGLVRLTIEHEEQPIAVVACAWKI